MVLDTNILIDLMRDRSSALRYLATLTEIPFCSEVTRVEALQGLRHQELRHAERLFGSIRWVSVDESIARRAGELGRTWRRSHPGIGTPDLIIAATAQDLGMALATLNVKHFPMFKGLRAPYRA